MITKMIENYKEMCLGDYLRLLEIYQDDSRSEEDKDLLAVALLNGMSEDEVLNLSIPEYLALKEKAGFLFYLPQKEKLKKEYKIGEYTCTLMKDYRQMTAFQYIDFKEFAVAEGEHFAEMLAVILVPKGCTYNNGYHMHELASAIKTDLSILDCIAIRDFFISKWVRSISNTLRSSERLLKKARRAVDKKMVQKAMEELILMQDLADLSKGGAGPLGSTPYLNLPILLGTRLVDELP